MGEKDAGTQILFSCLTKNSRVGGGQLGLVEASARILLRSSRSLYGQTCIHLFKPPSSLDIPAAKGEYYSRWGMAAVQRLSTSPMVPG